MAGECNFRKLSGLLQQTIQLNILFEITEQWNSLSSTEIQLTTQKK